MKITDLKNPADSDSNNHNSSLKRQLSGFIADDTQKMALINDNDPKKVQVI